MIFLFINKSSYKMLMVCRKDPQLDTLKVVFYKCITLQTHLTRMMIFNFEHQKRERKKETKSESNDF